MENTENLTQLLREYGYPEESIRRFLKDTEHISYEMAKKRIMPYQDITADRD